MCVMMFLLVVTVASLLSYYGVDLKEGFLFIYMEYMMTSCDRIIDSCRARSARLPSSHLADIAYSVGESVASSPSTDDDDRSHTGFAISRSP